MTQHPHRPYNGIESGKYPVLCEMYRTGHVETTSRCCSCLWFSIGSRYCKPCSSCMTTCFLALVERAELAALAQDRIVLPPSHVRCQNSRRAFILLHQRPSRQQRTTSTILDPLQTPEQDLSADTRDTDVFGDLAKQVGGLLETIVGDTERLRSRHLSSLHHTTSCVSRVSATSSSSLPPCTFTFGRSFNTNDTTTTTTAARHGGGND